MSQFLIEFFFMQMTALSFFVDSYNLILVNLGHPLKRVIEV